MKGLIIKEFKMMKHESILNFIIPIIFFIISLFGHSVYFSLFSIMMFTLLPTLNIANDEKYKWDRYEAVLPIKREHIVLEKYIIMFIFILPIIIAEAVIIYRIKDYSTHEIISLVSSMFLFGLLSPSIVLPVYFLFGYNTARIAGVPSAMIIYGIFSAVTMINSPNQTVTNEFLSHVNPILYFTVGIAIILISIMLSIIVYKRKEF